jgi:hypothetical protein
MAPRSRYSKRPPVSRRVLDAITIAQWRNPETRERLYKSLATSDDHVDSDGRRVMSFAEAQEAARAFFKSMERQAAGDFQPGHGVFTVAVALEDYCQRRG